MNGKGATVFLLFLILQVLGVPLFAVEKIDPVPLFCAADNLTLLKEPRDGAQFLGQLSLGTPVVVMARHNDWSGVFLKGGSKAWVPSAALCAAAEFKTRFPKAACDETALTALLAEASATRAPATPPPTAPAAANPESLKTVLADETQLLKDMEGAIVSLKKDSARVKDTIATLRTFRLRELDSLRLALNLIFKARKDSLASERAKWSDAGSAQKAAADLHEKRQTLTRNVPKLKRKAREAKERAMNLRILAQYEFDLDTSAEAKDSLLVLSSEYDSLARARESEIAQVDLKLREYASFKPEETTATLARIDSAERALPLRMKDEFDGLARRQTELDGELAGLKTSLTQAITDQLDNLRREYRDQAERVKAIRNQIGKKGR